MRHNGVVIHENQELNGPTGGHRNEPEGTPGPDASLPIGAPHFTLGMIKEFTVEKWYRDSKIYTIFEGTSEIQRMVIARALTS